MLATLTSECPAELLKQFEKAPYVWSYNKDLFKKTINRNNTVESTISFSVNTISEAKTDSLFLNVIEELERYQKFTIGWDGYRGVPFNRETVNKANQIVCLVQNLFKINSLYPDDITPGPASDGTIDLEIVFHNKTINFIIDSELQHIICSNSESYTDEIIEFNDETNLVKQLDWLLC